MKRIFPLLVLSIIFILFLADFYTKIHDGSDDKEASLSKSFGSIGARVISSEVYCWGRLEKQGTRENANLMVDDLLRNLAVQRDSSFTINAYENDNIQKTEIKGVTNDRRLVGIMVQFSKQADLIQDQYISVKVTEDLASARIEETRNTLIEVFSKYGIKGAVSSCITGSLDGRLDNDRLDEISRGVFKEAEARKVEGVREKNYVSVSAYSPYLEDFVKVNGKKVNLNLAIRYNSYENKTYIWLATPVITTEY